ncbi:MAG: gliding motility-associated C-terminal domain-containing protein [Bacteroidetes bacterium]|nr:gliding motility-associated C-terminal domain-containing protein [Bacteroidota bacterium]
MVDNLGCSILLEGTAPPWVNKLKWTPYETWLGGVKNYEIYRSDGETGAFQLSRTTADSVQWFLDDNLDVSVGKYHYFVRAFEGNGGAGASSTSNEIELFQPPYIFLPNAFTPNGDGNNDTWGGFENFVKEIKFSIFNRWGQLIYSGAGNTASWDGRFDGAPVPEGLYIYHVSYSGFQKGQNYSLHGTISLIR